MNDKKDFQYKIFKSEACGHTIEYKMVKKEHELEKAKIDEGLSPREKMKAREARSSKEREPKELNPDQYETGKKIARTKAVTATGEKQRKETLKDVLHTHKQNIPKSPSKEDLEYPMAASEEKDCMCKDCDCDKKEVKKSEKFYIQKIQELRKAEFGPAPRYKETPEDVARGKDLSEKRRTQDLANTQIINQNRASTGLPIQTRGTQSNAGDYVLKDAPQGGERTGTASVNQMTGMNRILGTTTAPTAAPTAAAPIAPPLAAPTAAPTEQTAAPTEQAPAQRYDMKNPYKVENAKNFKDAFNQAREKTGGGGNVFEYGGKKYHTYTQDEFKNPTKAGIEPDNKFYKDWQAKKDVTGPGAYYANKMNPTAATPASTQASTAQPPTAPAAKTPNPNANVTGMNPDGSISSTESDGRKTLTMPQNPIPTVRPDQMGILDRKYAQPGEVAAKIPSQSAMFPNGPTKNGDTATTTFPTSEKMEGNLDTHKMEGMTGKRLNYNQA